MNGANGSSFWVAKQEMQLSSTWPKYASINDKIAFFRVTQREMLTVCIFDYNDSANAVEI